MGRSAGPQHLGVRQTVAAVGVAAVIAAFGAAAIYAASAGDSTGRPGYGFGPPGSAKGMNGDGPAGVGAGGNDIAATSLHGEFVVSDGSGGYTTMITQTGRVTALSANSISARSADGYTQHYIIPSSGGGATPSFTVGQTVTIRATRTGATVTVVTIDETGSQDSAAAPVGLGGQPPAMDPPGPPRGPGN